MLDLVKITPPEEKYINSNMFNVEINDELIGLIQELIITEFKNKKEIRIDLSRLYINDDKVGNILDTNFHLNNDSFKLKIIENKINNKVCYYLNEAKVNRISTIYNAENYLVTKEYTIVSEIYFKEIEAKNNGKL